MATKYISYYPNTLEGQALLDNFVRTRRILRYRDNDRIVEHIKRGMPLYEVEFLEKRGANEKHNLMMHGECLSTCAYLKEQGVEVDLVYIDPQRSRLCQENLYPPQSACAKGNERSGAESRQ